jgi:hypothetical protein
MAFRKIKLRVIPDYSPGKDLCIAHDERHNIVSVEHFVHGRAPGEEFIPCERLVWDDEPEAKGE